MAKKQLQPKIENRKHITRSRKEAEERRKVLLGLAGLAALILLVLAIGLAYTYIVTPNQPVAIVNNAKISRKNYQHRVLYERYLLDEQIAFLQQQYQQIAQTFQNSPDLLKSLEDQANQQLNQVAAQRANVDRDALESMIEEELVVQEAARRGITVSDDDVTETYNEIAAARSGGYTETSAQKTVTARQNATATAALFTPTPTSTPNENATPTTTPEPTAAPRPTPTINVLSGDTLTKAVSDWETIVRDKTGMTPDDLREMVRRLLLKQKLAQAIGDKINSVVLQAHARHILVATEDEAKAAKKRLDNGESFEAVAADVSIDTGTKDTGGDLGWFPEGVMIAPFNDAVFSLDIGKISDPVQTQFGWHIIQVLQREERELDAKYLPRLRTKAYNDWLLKARGSGVQDLWTIDDAPPDPTRAASQAQSLPQQLPTPN